jgi:hypothetical protein
MFKYSSIIFDAIRRLFLTKPATTATFISVRFECGGHPSRYIVPGSIHFETMNTT